MPVRNTNSQGIGYYMGLLKYWLILTEQLLWADPCLNIKPRTQAAPVTATVYTKAKTRIGKENYPRDRSNNFNLILCYCKC